MVYCFVWRCEMRRDELGLGLELIDLDSPTRKETRRELARCQKRVARLEQALATERLFVNVGWILVAILTVALLAIGGLVVWQLDELEKDWSTPTGRLTDLDTATRLSQADCAEVASLVALEYFYSMGAAPTSHLLHEWAGGTCSITRCDGMLGRSAMMVVTCTTDGWLQADFFVYENGEELLLWHDVIRLSGWKTKGFEAPNNEPNDDGSINV